MRAKAPIKTLRSGSRTPPLRGGGAAVPVVRLAPEESLVMSFSVSLDPMLAIVDRHVKLTPSARQAIRKEWSAVAQGSGVVRSLPAAPVEEVLTTEQAAKVAGISRPFMVKLIDAGEVALHQMVGNQRRVLSSAVQRWRANERSRQAKAVALLDEELDEEIFSK